MWKTHLAFVLIALAFAPAARADDKPAALPPELRWIPANGAAFLHVRFGDLWNGAHGPVMRAALLREDTGALERIEQALGVPLTSIDRLTIVLPDAGGSSPGDGILLRITTREPYEERRVLAGIFGPERAARLKSRLSKLVELPERAGTLMFTDARSLTFAFGPPTLLHVLDKPAADGKLAPALQLAAKGHAIVAAADIAAARRIPWIADANELRPFLIARTAVLTGDVTPSGFNFALKFGVGLKSHGEEVAEAIEVRRRDMLTALPGILKDRDAPAKLIDAMTTAVKAVKTERRDREVSVALSLPSAEPLALVTLDAIDAVHATSNRTVSANNLKQIGLAFHNYHDTMGYLPSALFDKKNKPLLSWRVAVLPYIEQDNLYRQFKLDEPWDSAHNKKLMDQMPKIYALPGDRTKHAQPSTYYRVFVGNRAMFDMKQKTQFAHITDGLSNTIMCAEAADAVPWTKPDEIEYDPKKPPKFGFHFAGRGNVLLGDGSVHALRKRTDERTLHLLIQRDDGQVVSLPER